MFARFTLLLFVGLLGFDLGAGTYELRNVLPLEQAGLSQGRQPGVVGTAGLRFWIFVTPTLAVLAALALLGVRSAPAPQAGWRIASAGGELLIIATTFLYFIPTIRHIVDPSVTPYPPAVAATRLRQWIALNRVRVAATTVTFFAGLVALTRS